MNRDYFFGYKSLGDLVNHAAQDNSEMPLPERSSRRSDTGWNGATWETAHKLGLSGDVEGAARLAPAVLSAANAMVANQPRLDPVYRLDEGRWIDVARFVKGEPECWGDMVESTPAPRKGVAIVVNSSYNGSVSAQSVDKVGVVIGGVVLGLQALGYAVTLHVVSKAGGLGSGRDQMMTIHAPINPGGAPLDISRLCVVLRPWFLRRIIFSIMETYSEEIRRAFDTGGGYGRAVVLSAKDLEKITGVKNAIGIDIGDVVKNPAAVKTLILNQIKGA